MGRTDTLALTADQASALADQAISAHASVWAVGFAGIDLDPWQQQAVDQPGNQLWLCTRRGGKSTTAAVLAAYMADAWPGSKTICVSPGLRQSGELMRMARGFIRGAGAHLIEDNALSIETTSGSRILCLPGNEKTIRGLDADLAIIDEAARVDDELYHAVRPMLAVSGGRLVALSSAWAKRGWFYSAWAGSGKWTRTTVTASECRRIPAEFLERERSELPPTVYQREYECEFTDLEGSLFSWDQIASMEDSTLTAWTFDL